MMARTLNVQALFYHLFVVEDRLWLLELCHKYLWTVTNVPPHHTVSILVPRFSLTLEHNIRQVLEGFSREHPDAQAMRHTTLIDYE
jgi:hypothetical protein